MVCLNNIILPIRPPGLWDLMSGDKCLFNPFPLTPFLFVSVSTAVLSESHSNESENKPGEKGGLWLFCGELEDQ